MTETPRGRHRRSDVAGLSTADRDRIRHPSVGGVILFARNYESPARLSRLTAQIRALRDPAVVIAVDHEGGRVQRFREGFTLIPPMRTLGEAWDRDVAAAAREATRLGRTIATELRAHGIDFSFTPVLDLDYGTSAVIGDRAFHRNPNAVAHLGSRASRRACMRREWPQWAKHFPGHGHVAADSHIAIPVDPRPYEQIARDDLVPFEALGEAAALDGIMPAHVIYPAVDAQPAGYSRIWLQEILRGKLGFDGMVFSDDLGMAGATGAGDMRARASAAQAAGCDMVLVCNDPEAADLLLDRWRPVPNADLARRLETPRRRV